MLNYIILCYRHLCLYLAKLRRQLRNVAHFLLLIFFIRYKWNQDSRLKFKPVLEAKHMKKIFSVFSLVLLSLSVQAFSVTINEKAIVEKCTRFGHWSMIRCIELNSQNVASVQLGPPSQAPEQFQSVKGLGNAVNPIAPNKISVEKGKTTFYQYCFSCHGMDGRGHGPAAEYVERPMPDLTSPKVNRETDGVLFWTITRGQIPRPMPAFGDFLNQEDIWNMINYIRTLSGKVK